MLRPDFVPENGQGQPDTSQGNNFFSPAQSGGQSIHPQQQGFGVPMVNSNIPPGHPGATGQRYYTIQRVNGNGGNGKGDGVAGPHKHTLAESDRVKKNSVQRFLMKKDKEEKKTQVRLVFLIVLLIAFYSVLVNHTASLVAKAPPRPISPKSGPHPNGSADLRGSSYFSGNKESCK